MAIRNKDDYTHERVIDLTGPDGNAFVLLATAQRLARQLDLDADQIREEMTAGDYDHLVETFDSYFGHIYTLLR